MKKIKKLVALLLSLITVGAFAACGGGSSKSDPSTVQFYFWQSGFGSEYIKKIVDAYNKKQDAYKVVLETTPNQSTITSTLQLGEANTYDLYIVPCPYDFTKIMEPLDDVLDYTNPGETKSIREKIGNVALGTKTRTDGKVYDLPYADSIAGLFYNKSIIDGTKYSVPKTTDELDDLVWDLQEDGKPAFVHFNDGSGNGYYSYLYEVWNVQYEGLDYYRNTFMKLKDADGKSPSKDILTAKDGRWKTLQVMESIFTKDTVSSASNEQDFTTAQTSLFNGEGVMMVNGSWLKNEMAAQLNDKVEGYGVNEDIIMMKTPVISSIVEKLEYSAMTDKELSSVISAIDENKDYAATKTVTGISRLTENDYKRIREARTLRYNSLSGQNFFIPNYSDAKDGAKDFMKYMYSDEGLLIFLDTVHLRNAADLDDPTKLNFDGWSNWDKYHYELAGYYENGLLDSRDVSDLFIIQGFDSFLRTSIIPKLTAKNAKDVLTAAQIWDSMLALINQNWKYWFA